MSEEMQQDGTEQFEEQAGNGEYTGESAQNQIAADDEDEEDEDERKLFVGGLSWETSTKDLREYFEKFGEVTNCTLKTDLETKKSRGFGFVVLGSKEAVEKVLAEKEHKLHGKNIDPKQATPRQINKKVFVGKLDPSLSEEEVKAYFETFGPVEKIDLPFDKTKEQRRAFAFVEFKKLASLKKCLSQTVHKINNKEVDVKKATPPGAPVAARGAGTRGRGFSSGPTARGGSWGGRGGYTQGGYGYNPGYGGYGNYGGYGYDQNYGYGGYSGDYYGSGYGGYGGWNSGSYDPNYGYGYGTYNDWGYGQGTGGQTNYGKIQKRGAGHGGYHPYTR